MPVGASYRQPRRPVGLLYSFEHGLETIDAEIHDLSRSGARVDGDFNFAGPDEITLLFRNMRFPARIVWMRFGTMGITFNTPLDKATYTALLGHSSKKKAATQWVNSHGV